MNIYKKLAGATLLAMGLIAFQGVFAVATGDVTDERQIVATNNLSVGSGTQTGGALTATTGAYTARSIGFDISSITNNSPNGWTITAKGANGMFMQCAASPCAATPTFSGTVATGDAFEYTLLCVGSTVTDTAGHASAPLASATDIGTTATTVLSFLTADGHVGLATAGKTSTCSMDTAANLLKPVEAGDYQETITFTIANGS